MSASQNGVVCASRVSFEQVKFCAAGPWCMQRPSRPLNGTQLQQLTKSRLKTLRGRPALSWGNVIPNAAAQRRADLCKAWQPVLCYALHMSIVLPGFSGNFISGSSFCPESILNPPLFLRHRRRRSWWHRRNRWSLHHTAWPLALERGRGFVALSFALGLMSHWASAYPTHQKLGWSGLLPQAQEQPGTGASLAAEDSNQHLPVCLSIYLSI